jgi:hypothetical protein
MSRRSRCSSQLAGSGRSSCSTISDWSALPARIASMMSGANNGRRLDPAEVALRGVRQSMMM